MTCLTEEKINEVIFLAEKCKSIMTDKKYTDAVVEDLLSVEQPPTVEEAALLTKLTILSKDEFVELHSLFKLVNERGTSVSDWEYYLQKSRALYDFDEMSFDMMDSFHLSHNLRVGLAMLRKGIVT
jgi:hypothetical protein